MTSPPPAMYDAAQRALGVIAARGRGDLEAAEELLASFDDDACKAGGFFLASELAIRLLAEFMRQDIATCASELSMSVAAGQYGSPPD
jgi:7-keto-8-aminopelargonate synthetase-like enzyme